MQRIGIMSLALSDETHEEGPSAPGTTALRPRCGAHTQRLMKFRIDLRAVPPEAPVPRLVAGQNSAVPVAVPPLGLLAGCYRKSEPLKKAAYHRRKLCTRSQNAGRLAM